MSQFEGCERIVTGITFLVCSVVVEGKKKIPSALPLSPPAGKGADSFPSRSTVESRPCTLSGQHSGADPVDKARMSQPPRERECGRSDPTPLLS